MRSTLRTHSVTPCLAHNTLFSIHLAHNTHLKSPYTALYAILVTTPLPPSFALWYTDHIMPRAKHLDSETPPLDLQTLKRLSLQMPVFEQPLIRTADDLKGIINDYFSRCIEEERPPTMTGLAKALHVTREELMGAYHHDPEFRHILDVAKLSVIEFVEELLLRGKVGSNLIFWLKNNAGWIDKVETVSHTKTAAEILQELNQQGHIIDQSNPLNQTYDESVSDAVTEPTSSEQ